MAQLYHTRQVPPGEWLLSGPETGSQLELRAAATIVYAAGGSDTLPAYTPAVLTGGTSTFDRSTDVYVPYVVKGDPTLRLIKEADLPTLTDDYAPLARVELHAVKPYQPEPYLAAGGLGTAPATTSTPLLSDGTWKALSLWNGSGSNAPPSGWETVGFNDSAWTTAAISLDDSGGIYDFIPAARGIWPTASGAGLPEDALFRAHVVLPAGTLVGATLRLIVDDDQLGAWINGTFIAGTAVGFRPLPAAVISVPVPLGVLLAGSDNVIAVWCRNTVDATRAELELALDVTYVGSGGVPSPGGAAEGDLLYYHGGAWVPLPAGTNGDELTMVAGDPAWTAQPADSDTSGTVTSVALAGPTGTTVSGSPVTSSGTLTLSWASQSANTVLAAPNGSSGAPTFRALVGADIPVDASTIISSAGTIKGNYQAGSGVSISGNTISATGSGGSVTSVALSLPGIFSVSGSPVTTNGTLSAVLATQAKATVFAGPASGSAAAPTFRALQSSDLPAAAGAGGRIHAHGHFL